MIFKYTFSNLGFTEEIHYLVFFCPGCDDHVCIPITGPNKWDWDEKTLTLTPSISQKRYNNIRCHLNITNGKIIYHTDSNHKLTGTTIDLPELKDDL